jgi:hypothetical protein
MEGANCADLPPFVIDKYFGCKVNVEPFRARVARAICSHCAVIELCRDEALNQIHLPERGVLAGVNVVEIRRARAWRSYELGLQEAPPLYERPSWLPMTDATNTVEQSRFETEEGVER